MTQASMQQRRTIRQSMAQAPVNVLGVGNGGVEELVGYLDDANVAWAVLRFQVAGGGGDGTARVKFISIHFNGEEVPTVKRGRLNARTAEVLQMMGNADASIEVKRKAELSVDMLVNRMLPVFESSNVSGTSSSAKQLQEEYLQAIEECRKQAPKKDAAAAKPGIFTAKDRPELGITAKKALEAVGGQQGPFNWVLLEPTKLEIHNAGFGGLEEMRTNMDEKLVLFGLARFAFGRAEAQCGTAFVPGIVKHVFIHWVGPKVPVVRRGQWNAKQNEAEKEMKAFCVPIFRKEVHSEDELSLEEMVKELQRASVASNESANSDQAKIAVADYNEALDAEKQAIMDGGADKLGNDGGLPDAKMAIDTVRGTSGQWNWALLCAASGPQALPGQSAASRPSQIVRKDTAEQAAEQVAADKAKGASSDTGAADKAAADKAATDKAAADKAAADKATAAKAAADKAATDKAAADKMAADKAGQDAAAAKSAADKAAADKAAAAKAEAAAEAEKAAAAKAAVSAGSTASAAEKAAADKVAAEKAAFDAAVEKAAEEKANQRIEKALDEQRKSLTSENSQLIQQAVAEATSKSPNRSSKSWDRMCPDEDAAAAGTKRPSIGGGNCRKCGQPQEFCRCKEDDDDTQEKASFKQSNPIPQGFLGAFDCTAEPGVEQLGWFSSSMPPEEVIVVQVEEGSWAGIVGLKTGDELMELQGKDVSDVDQQEFIGFMHQRPLVLSFYRQEGAMEKMLQRGSLPGTTRGSTPLRPSVVNRLNCTEDVRASVVVRQNKDAAAPNRTSQVAQAFPAWEDFCGELHIKGSWAWKRRFFQLAKGRLAYWHSKEIFMTTPRPEPDVDLILVENLGRWKVEGLKGSRFEMNYHPTWQPHPDEPATPKTPERKSLFGRASGRASSLGNRARSGSNASSASPAQPVDPNKKAIKEQYLIAADDIASATEWARAIWHHIAYVDMLSLWPMPLEGRQGDISFYGIEHPS